MLFVNMEVNKELSRGAYVLQLGDSRIGHQC